MTINHIVMLLIAAHISSRVQGVFNYSIIHKFSETCYVWYIDKLSNFFDLLTLLL